MEMGDAPGWIHSWGGIAGFQIEGSQDFETCAVCLSGLEGLRYVLTPPAKGSLTVYGCVRWGHSFVKNSTTGSDIWTRYVNDKLETGDENKTGVLVAGAQLWGAPSQEWKDAVNVELAGKVYPFYL